MRIYNIRITVKDVYVTVIRCILHMYDIVVYYNEVYTIKTCIFQSPVLCIEQ